MKNTKRLYRRRYKLPKASFLSGFGSIFSISGNYYSKPKVVNNDYEAIASDWSIIGDDIRTVFKRELSNKN